MRNHSYENDFDLHENETARRTHFHMKGSALRRVLKQRHRRTRKWPIKFSRGHVRTRVVTAENTFISANTGRISDILSFLESLYCVLKLGLRYFFFRCADNRKRAVNFAKFQLST